MSLCLLVLFCFFFLMSCQGIWFDSFFSSWWQQHTKSNDTLDSNGSFRTVSSVGWYTLKCQTAVSRSFTSYTVRDEISLIINAHSLNYIHHASDAAVCYLSLYAHTEQSKLMDVVGGCEWPRCWRAPRVSISGALAHVRILFFPRSVLLISTCACITSPIDRYVDRYSHLHRCAKLEKRIWRRIFFFILFCFFFIIFHATSFAYNGKTPIYIEKNIVARPQLTQSCPNDSNKTRKQRNKWTPKFWFHFRVHLVFSLE